MAFLKTFLRSLKKIFKPKRVSAKRSLSSRKKTSSRVRKNLPKRKVASISSAKSVKKQAPAQVARRKTKPFRKSSQKTISVKKTPGNRVSGKRSSERIPLKTKPAGILIGEITHYFSKIEVVVVKLTKGSLKVGDKIAIRGGERDFVQAVRSLQIESVDVPMATRGKLVGLKTIQPAREGDKVFLLG